MDHATRKAMKAQARATMRRHYWLLVVTCLAAAFLGTGYASSLWPLTARIDVRLSAPGQGDATGESSPDMATQLWMLVGDIAGGDEDRARSQVSENEDAIRRGDVHPALGRSRGVFAQVLNSFSSGRVVLSVLDAVRSMARSSSVAVIVLVLVALAVFCFVWLFLQETYRVVDRRIVLEARVYDRVPAARFLYPLQTRRWARMAWVMFVRSAYLTLWTFTVVGLPVKTFSYFLVPYIVAENPSVTANEAISLSRRMMRGHKWECFVAHLSFAGWWLLTVASFGLVGILYANGYRSAFFAHYHASLRAEARRNGLPGSQLLADDALYARPDPAAVREAYADAEDALVRVHDESGAARRPAGVTGLLAGWFGILLRRDGTVARWERHEAQLAAVSEGRDILGGRLYPGRLAPVPMPFRIDVSPGPGALRSYTLLHLAAMFLIFSLVGWVWEVALAFLIEGVFVNRGTLHGPWLPIYGAGGIAILVLLRRLRDRPALLFVGAMALCGTLEYVSSWYLEAMHGERWWDYSGYFLNLNGRICAEGLLVFGLGGMAIVYLLAPALDDLLCRVDGTAFTVAVVALLLVYGVDQAYSLYRPNAGAGITDYRTASAEAARPLPQAGHAGSAAGRSTRRTAMVRVSTVSILPTSGSPTPARSLSASAASADPTTPTAGPNTPTSWPAGRLPASGSSGNRQR